MVTTKLIIISNKIADTRVVFCDIANFITLRKNDLVQLINILNHNKNDLREIFDCPCVLL